MCLKRKNRPDMEIVCNLSTRFKKLEIVFWKVIIILQNINFDVIKLVNYCIITGLNESSIVPWSLSIENAILVEDIRKKLGVTICK